MFDFLNPALREGKRRAREEYKQRMLQGKIDEAMRHAREDADRKLAARETFHREFPRKFKMAIAMVLGVLLAIAMSH